VTISETSTASKKRAPQVGIADKLVSDPCYRDWKRFCFVLREIARGEDGRPLSGLEAQKRAQAVLTECGYQWWGRTELHKPVVVPTADPESHNTQAPVGPGQTATDTKLKGIGQAQLPSGRRRSDPLPNEHRVGAVASSGRS
jgi:hypothetical protein